jgi:hypothetical protein
MLSSKGAGIGAFIKYLALILICVQAFSIRLFSVVKYESVIHEVRGARSWRGPRTPVTRQMRAPCCPPAPRAAARGDRGAGSRAQGGDLTRRRRAAQFDPYFNYRVTQFLTKEGFYNLWNWFDENTWYPLGRVVGGTVYPVRRARVLRPASRRGRRRRARAPAPGPAAAAGPGPLCSGSWQSSKGGRRWRRLAAAPGCRARQAAAIAPWLAPDTLHPPLRRSATAAGPHLHGGHDVQDPALPQHPPARPGGGRQQQHHHHHHQQQQPAGCRQAAHSSSSSRSPMPSLHRHRHPAARRCACSPRRSSPPSAPCPPTAW